MPSTTQRKQFDHVEFAKQAATGFHMPEFQILGVKVSTTITTDREGVWLYVTHMGDFVPQPPIILPEYELVDAS